MKFNDDKTGYFFGKVIRCYLGYATDLQIREYCASGGIVSALLIHLLESEAIHGALVSRFEIDDGIFRARSLIATTREDILSCGGSIYADVSPISLNALKRFSGRVAVVGLPCYLKGIHRLCENDKAFNAQVVVKIGLFCGHNSKKELLLAVLRKKGIDPETLDGLRFRRGKWRGQMEVRLKTGETVLFPFSHFSIYQNLHLFSQRRCIHCADHTAEHADVSCGDAWLRELKAKPVKHSIFITRTQQSDVLVKQLAAADRIRIKAVSPQDVFRSQKRSLIHHKSLKAKSKTAPVFGYRILCSGMSLDRWNDRLAALISLGNIKWSESERYKHLIFWIPRPVLFLYLLIFKALTNF